MKTAVAALAGLSLCAMSLRPAAAHDQWADDGPVPAWVEARSCGPSDAHHLSPDQVHVTPDGDRLAGYARAIREDRLSPSPDGSRWVFYRTFDGASRNSVYCFVGPESGS